MTLRTDLLPVVDELRALAGPAGFDVRPTQVTVRTRTWNGGRRGAGQATDSDLVLPQIYKARSVSGREVAGSGGRYEIGDVKVGPITPQHATGGYTRAQLAPDPTEGLEVVYLLTGGIEGEFSLVDYDADKPFSSFLTLRRIRTTP